MTTTPARPVSIVVDEALAGGPHRRIEDLNALATELRAHLDALVPAAKQHVDSLWHGDPMWYVRRATLDGLPRLLAAGIGDGPESATRHVRDLAITCHIICGWLAGGQEPVGAAPARGAS